MSSPNGMPSAIVLARYLTEMSRSIVEVQVPQPLIKSGIYPDGPGVYCLFNSSRTPIFVGEGRDLRAKLNDFYRTVSSPLRRTLGRELFGYMVGPGDGSAKKGFSASVEYNLDAFITNNIFVVAQPLDVGRKEIAELILDIYKPFYNLNSLKAQKPFQAGAPLGQL